MKGEAATNAGRGSGVRWVPVLVAAALCAVAVAASSDPGAGPRVRWKHLSSKTGELPMPNGGTQQTACVIGDIDGDGHLDIFCAEMAKWTEDRKDPDNPNAKAWILYGDGKGGFQTTEFASGYGFHEARVADVNGDGRLDVVSKPYNWETPRLDIWMNEGTVRSRR